MSRHQHHHHKPSHGDGASPRKLPRHWLFVVAVILMLAAMMVYVLTLDESTEPEPGKMPVEEAADI